MYKSLGTCLPDLHFVGYTVNGPEQSVMCYKKQTDMYFSWRSGNVTTLSTGISDEIHLGRQGYGYTPSRERNYRFLFN